MEGISRNIYNYLSKIDKLRENDYKKLIDKYGREIVHTTIDYMIDENERNISKFEYYIDKLISDLENYEDRNILDTYMHDIGKTSRLSDGENEIYGSIIYEIILKLRNLFELINCEYNKKDVSMFSSILDECQFYSENCSNVEIIEQIRELSLRFIDMRNILIVGNLRLVIATLKNYYRDSDSFMEIIQYGNVGLMKAVEKYNPNFKTKFVTYAYYWIRQSIRDALRFEFTSATTVSYNAIEKNNSRLKVINVLTNELGRRPTGEEISEKLGISNRKLNDIETLFQEPVSLSMTLIGPRGDETTTTLSDLYEDRNADVEREVCEKMLRFEILEIVKKYLNEQQQFIILNKFGFYGEPMSFEQIGSIYGVTKQHIQQTHKRALTKIKRIAGNKLVDYLK